MQVAIDQSKPFAVARVAGVLGVAESSEFLEQMHTLVAERGSKLIIGLEEVESISSAGLSALVAVVTHARMVEGRVILVGPSTFVRGILDITNLDDWFEICDDFAEAKQRMA